MMKKLILLILISFIPCVAHALEISTGATSLGIGTNSTSNALSIANTLAVGDATYTQTAAPTGGAIFQGNVGVGVTGPTQKLDVAGTGNFQNLTLCGAARTFRLGDDSSNDISITWDSTQDYGKIQSFRQGIADTLLVNPSGGNVGIATVTAAAQLDVNGGANVAGELTVAGTGNRITMGSFFLDSDDNPGVWTESGAFAFNSGNVGVGTIAPAKKLDVQGTAQVNGTFTFPQMAGSGNQCLRIDNNGVVSPIGDDCGTLSGGGSGTVNSGIKNFYGKYPGTGIVIDDTSVTMDDGTNVGIGTTSPKNQLDIHGAAVIGASYGGINTAPTNGLLVQGNLGVGSTNPGQTVDIAGTLRNRGTNAHFLGDDNSISLGASATTAGDLKFTTNSAETMRLSSGGNLGIGSTAPGAALDVNGRVRVRGTNLMVLGDDAKVAWASTAGTSGDMRAFTNSQERLRITSTNGNVGIGTTITSYMLNVKNDIATSTTNASDNHAVCWKAVDANGYRRLGYCSAIVDVSGVCGTCN